MNRSTPDRKPTPDPGQTPPRIVALVPVGELEGAKSRLGGTLDAEERRDLVMTMLRRTIVAAAATPGLAETLVVSPDREVITLAGGLGARTVRQRSQGLNQGLREARDDAAAGGADAVAILPIDLPLVSSDSLTDLIAPVVARPGQPVVVLAPDRHGRGTNALVVAPPDLIPFAFGGDSRAAHAACAREVGATYIEVDGPLRLDLDTPDDLLLVEAVAPDSVHAR